MVALRTRPPSRSGNGGTSVPPPAKLMRRGVLARMSTRRVTIQPVQGLRLNSCRPSTLRAAGMEILFLSTVLPHGRVAGGEIGSHAVLDALAAAGHDVTVVGYRRAGEGRPAPPG